MGIGRKLWYQRRNRLLERLEPGASIGMDGILAMQSYYQKGGFEISFRDERYEIIGKEYMCSQNISTIASVDLKQITEFDYGATSGAVIDAQIFNFEVIFRCPVRFRMIEDLWLSFIIKHILGQCVQRLFSTPVTNIAELYNKHDDDSLFLKLKEDKQKCLEELVESGFLNGETIKTDILNKMLVNDDSHILLSKFVIV
jgi:hypothetical protein